MDADKFMDFDHASTTQTRAEVVEAMLPYFSELYGNAGSRHRLGVGSNKAINRSRRVLAEILDADNEGIYYTSGATEANNWALRGIAYGYAEKGRHIITSRIEHPSVLETCRRLEKEGFSVTYLSVDSRGRISLTELENSIRKDTILVSVMYVNNETGVIQPIEEIASICRKHQVLFHTDAVQAFGKLPFSVKKSGIDLLTISGHKIYGPKGIGCLYARKYLKLEPLLLGGHQQNGMRAGTEPVPQIVGLSTAAILMKEELVQVRTHMKALRDTMKKRLSENFEQIVFHENEENQLPDILSVSFPGKEAEQILAYLDTKKIYASGGSACSSGDRKPSHVLQAMGKSAMETKGAIRFSFGRENTTDDIEAVINALKIELNKP